MLESVVVWHDCVISTMRVRKKTEKPSKRMETKIQVTFSTKQGPMLTLTDIFKSLNVQKVVSFMGILFMPVVATQAK